MTSKVIHFVIDGCRPDALQQTATPNIDALAAGGAYSWTAQAVMPSVTLPCHNSMFRGVLPEKHGIYDNTFDPIASRYPSTLEVASEAGLKTAMFISWEELRDLSAPGKLDALYHRRSRPHIMRNDLHIAQTAASYITAEQPDLVFIYLGDVDESGHMYGWMSQGYLDAVTRADTAIGFVLEAIYAAGLRDDYTILVNSDHGGHDTSHGTDSPEDMNIVWVLNGPSVKAGYQVQAPICLIDIPATITHVLGIKAPASWDGQVVETAFS